MTSGRTTVVAVLGVGEAGAAIVADLLDAGVTVRAYDPVACVPRGAVTCAGEAEAVSGADLVLSVNSAAAARRALTAGIKGASGATVWADLNTAAPELERALATEAAVAGLDFADVSLMAPVPGRGLRTPMLASGTGASRYAGLLAPLGASVEVLHAPAGEAAQRKLLRSVFFKGMAAAVIEALRAASEVGLDEWMRGMIAQELAAADKSYAARLEHGSVQHAVRRHEEMVAAVELLVDLGVPPRIAAASRDWLADLADHTSAPR